ncbi:hypothetical protein [Zestomonas carbonaria]|uniref:Uncharacterized protein n=1 Tax=Zestomonas carbonaria TaxID=2762745 RepID=A0A7U7IBN3_9GAMM|nr:hypothetical protein [Pseudomonas carbonaria]CAD5110106.1 hypothetical protein PSEWESI4_04422 [Pseudomonas carbonaria]
MTETSTSTTDTPEQPVQAHPWAELGPEQFHLLRLAPLPTDRYTGVRPLRFVQLGRVERHTPAQSLLRLTVQLPGQRLRREMNLLEVWADHRGKEIRFGADSGLQIEPVNRGLGRFLLAQGIAWARQRWAHYRVEGGALGIKDALSDDARARRDHFLRSQGFDVEYQDALQLKAQYSAERVSSLHPDWHKDKVQVVGLQDAAAMLEQADRNLQEQENKIRKLEERIAVFKREDGTLRFTITCLVAFAVFQAGLLIWIATR